MGDTERLALFPLGLVLLPGMGLPLHIFEERYRTLIGDCLDSDQEFGIVYYNGTDLRRTGCTAKIIHVIKKYEDGRSDIFATGSRRFQIDRIHEDHSYLRADVSFFADAEDHEAPSAQELGLEALTKIRELAALTGRKIDIDPLGRLSSEQLSFLLSATEILNLEEKQEGLEITSTSTRLQTIITSAKRSIDRIKSTREIQKILGTDADISHIFN